MTTDVPVYLTPTEADQLLAIVAEILTDEDRLAGTPGLDLDVVRSAAAAILSGRQSVAEVPKFRTTKRYRVTAAAVAPHHFQTGTVVRYVSTSRAGDRHVFTDGAIRQWLAADDVEEAS